MADKLQQPTITNRGYFPIAYKLAIVISLLIIAGMSLLGLIIAREQSLLIERQSTSFSNTLVTQIAETSKESLLANDLLTLEVAINNLLKHDYIIGVALYSDEFENLTHAGLTPPELPANTQHHNGIIHWQDKTAENDAPMVSHIQTITIRNVTVGYALITFEQGLVAKSQRRTIKAVMGTTLLFVFLGIIAAFVLSKRLTRPIQDLLQASRAISLGKYDIPLLQMRNDELGTLMTSLGSMSEGLLRKDQVEKTFSKYVSPEIAKTVLKDLQAVELGGKQVNASVLFADIAGFTSLSEKLPPQELNALLNEYFSYISKAAQKFNGYVDKYIGDCAMLVFGIPEHDELHSPHAVACAVLINLLIEELNKQREKDSKPTVLFRIGINSGKMLAGNMGAADRMEYTVIGDAVNIAARLSAACKPGEVLICEALNQSAELNNCIDSSQNGILQFHGKEIPVTTYVVNGLCKDLQAQVNQAASEILPS